MKQAKFAYFAIFISFVLVLSGCVSVANSPSPRFYTLQAMDEKQVGKKFNLPTNPVIRIGPVRIPEYQNRPQIVTQDKDGMLSFAQFDRWGEPLEYALGRIIGEDLRIMLIGSTIEMRSWDLDIPVKYRVIIDVVQIESRLDKGLFFACQWSAIDAQNKKVLLIKRSEFSYPITPHSYSGLTKALSLACASLSKEIAQGLVSSANQPEMEQQQKNQSE